MMKAKEPYINYTDFTIIYGILFILWRSAHYTINSLNSELKQKRYQV